ncbi:ubiquitin-specific protease ubp2 [Castilleja foliolosa]|uniref:ubiquitinyl hydrolase 1 n=1 Tax=Castilleja foliolosa TaxID=1961234 RepID=A0ABD3D099_9LAMI
MAKKVKKKPKSGQKDKRGPSTTPKTVSEHDTSISESPNNGVAGVVDTRICSHIDKGINMDKLSVKIGTSESFRCEDCRGQITDTRSKKGKDGKHGKKVGTISKSKSKAIWICLECGHFSCGGLGFPTTPQSHAVRHAKQNHHPLAVHYKNHYLVWCFLCDKIIPVEKSEDGKHKETFKEVLKMLKRKPGEGSNVNVEDVWFGSGSVTSAVKSSDYQISVPDVKVGYSIRGLVNLGNTCFFNSVMQNLLPIHSLREYLFELDESVGPLIASLRKFFLETNSEAGFKGAINPRSLFGSLCTKAPQFRGYQQHDSHELLRCLLNDLSTEELSARKRNESSITGPTFVDTIFGGQLSSTVSCLECGHSSTLYEPFLDLSLPVPTKKPPARRQETKTAVFGPVARGKKPKPPPKRPGRNYSKLSRVANNRPRESTWAQSTDDNILGKLQTIPQPLEQGVLSPGDYALSDFIDPNDIALDMGFTVENLSSLDDLSTEELIARKRNESSITGPTFVDTIFGGQLSSTVSCLECGHSSTLYEPFLDLSLPVPTKKPPARRQETKTAVFGPVARGKKPKPPPKRPGRNYSKLSREANNRPRESTSAQSTDDNILGNLQTIPQPLEQGVLSPGDYALSDFIDPNDIALDMGFTVENLPSLDDLSTEELSARKRNESSITGPTFVDTIFGGQLSSTVSCLECGHSSTLYEPFLDLSLPVPTKKPPARRQETKTAVFGPVARGKKPKPPPKRPGRNYSKLSRVANNRPRESTSAQSTDDNILGKLQTIPQPLEQGVLSPGDYALSDFIDPNDIALDMGFTVENLSSLDDLSTEELIARKRNESSITGPTFVDTIFGGQLSSTVSCLECGHSSTLYEPFLDLSLPVPTKKPPARRQETKTAVFGPVARGKKPKPPPKRPGRNYSKLSREANNRPRESTSAQSTDDNVLGKLQTIPQPLEQGVLSPGDYALSDFIDPNDIALDMGFTVENLSSVQNPNNEQTVENVGEQSISSDNFAWLDYLLPENDIAKESDEISAIQGLSNENALQNDFSLSITMDSKDESNLATAFSATSLDNAEHFNASVIGPLTRDQDALSPLEDKQNGNSQSSEVVQDDADIGHNSESNTLGKVNEEPTQIQDSQVILLPSKEMEVSSSSIPGDEQDSLDFGGFEDLFNELEPEVPFGPVSEANTKNGVIDNSESDPDEVDNSDTPVSVESCLALFTTPELLFKDEHAWQCDNCSKVMRERKIRLRSKLQLPISEAVQNGCAENITGPSEEIHENGDCTRLQNHLETEIYASELLSENTEPLKLDACASLNNEDVNLRELDKNGFAECDLLSAEHESESELTNEKEDKVNLEKLKVKTDAAKTMLITKVPSVLTIQLKRFIHDARGRLSKLNGHVNFRETIDLKPYMDPRCSEGDSFRYRLVGLVEHLGSMRGGHYVAYVRGSKEYGDCVWYHASDAYVRQASLEEVMRSQAYILFYEKI